MVLFDGIGHFFEISPKEVKEKSRIYQAAPRATEKLSENLTRSRHCKEAGCLPSQIAGPDSKHMGLRERICVILRDSVFCLLLVQSVVIRQTFFMPKD